MTVNLDSTETDPPYRILVNSKPTNARLTIDGKNRGKTPWTGKIKSGRHTFELTKPGHRRWTSTVEVTSGLSLTADLASVQSGGSNKMTDATMGGRTDASGRGAAVEKLDEGLSVVMPVDDPDPVVTNRPGDKKGTKSDSERGSMNGQSSSVSKNTSAATSTATGQSQSDAAGLDEQRKAEKKALEERKKQPGKVPATIPLNVQSNPGEATLFINGEKKGTTPFVAKKFSSGTTTIRLTKDGYREWNETFFLDEPTRLTVQMKSLKAYLTIQSNLSGLTVKIDGRTFTVNGKQTFEIKPGTYDVRAGAAGFEPRTRTVSLEAGASKTMEFSFDRRAKAWNYPTTRDVFLRMARENMGDLISDFGIGAGQRLAVIPEYQDWAHQLMDDVLSVVMNRNAILVVNEPSIRKADGALDREFKFYIVEMDVQYEPDGESGGFNWLRRHFNLKVHAKLIHHKTGEVQFTKFFETTTTDRIPAELKDVLRTPYQPPQTEPPL